MIIFALCIIMIAVILVLCGGIVILITALPYILVGAAIVGLGRFVYKKIKQHDN